MSRAEPTSSRRLVPLPIAGGLTAVAVLIATVLMFAAVLGGAAASSNCTTTGGGPAAVPGAPADLQPIFDAAAHRYELGSQGASILAGLTSIESGFGQNLGPSSAGAIGWTQFMPATWQAYGVDANGDGKKDPYTAEDAIFASARYLKASGAPGDWYQALFAYNHADWYVTKVLARARQLAATPASGPPSDLERQESVLVVGDSLAVGTAPELRALIGEPVVTDASVGRRSSTGIAVLRRFIYEGSYRAVVFDLGTNDPDVAELRRSLRDLTALAGDLPVIVATVNSPFDERAKNKLLNDFASRHPNVTLISWHERSKSLGLPDGIHGSYPQRARLFADALGTNAPAVQTCANVGIAGAVRRVETGGHLVAIPGQPGQLIDSRILADVAYLIRTYNVTITAGYAPTGHAADGEHPLGLACDIVPGPSGSWDDIDRLARWAEPAQNAPRPPFRWVGYDGDANHGRGNHLHLSWNHAPAPTRQPPAGWVDTFSTAT